MNKDNLKSTISEKLAGFASFSLKNAATALLNTLGYSSDKTIDLDGSPVAFLDYFNQQPEATRFNEKKAMVEEWQEIQLLFQLTDDEISSQASLFQDNELRQGLMHSYLFFAVKLKGESYTRGRLADITRHINRLFPQPVMVLFEYEKKVAQASSLKEEVAQASSLKEGVAQASSLSADNNNKQDACATLSIAVINRRQHKRDADKDVLGKVTLIQDINLENPHRGHLDIIESFSIPALQALDKRKPINNFDALHEAWEQVFNVELLNKKFYRELSDWYFWAMDNVRFPYDQLDPDKNKDDLFKDTARIREHDAKNLIRLLTRLLFVWFVKEKGLIPDAFFEEVELKKMLKELDPKSDDTNYYKAILQNLFFATLNQTHGKREFRNPGQNHNITTLLRYEPRFTDPQKFIELLEAHVPFMNGGLFECLDKPHPTLKGPQGGAVTLYEDGFSDRKDNILNVPDYLFFAEEQTIDLSDIYGDTKRTKEKVRGIIPLLNSYKFTIMENTPVEQEIALDPELLGKVFENLLASYNPETKTTARKQTGSFYTPRTIVDYMVDESLKAYLLEKVAQASSLNEGVTQASSLNEGVAQASSLNEGVAQASSLNEEVTQASSLNEEVAQASSLNDNILSKQDACSTFFDPNNEVAIANRNLPHWHQDGVIYFITFRLADSLPKEKLEQLDREREAWQASHREPFTDEERAEYHRLFSERVEQWLDAGAGSCCLKHSDIAKVVGDALRHFDGDRYRLDNWVVMPNHVHALLVPLGSNKVNDILHSWKSFTATKINKMLGNTGRQLWQHESYDHIVRSEKELYHYRKYIDENPLKAHVRVAQASSLKEGVTQASILKEGVTQASSLTDKEVTQASSLKEGVTQASSLREEVAQASSLVEELKSKQDACFTLTLAQRIDQLFQYSDEAPLFSVAERNALIKAIDSCKILDPACGSGAFPMGVLLKLVYILGKLDPQDELWKLRQIEKVDATIKAAEQIDDADARDNTLQGLESRKEDIQDSFDNNQLGYGRKLYLIENCIYGVDIQSIATQISKLRFFISLVVDQTVNKTKDNFNIRSLPNLETKFVAANTLIGIEKPGEQGMLFELTQVKVLENELKKVRHELFNAKTPKTKNAKRQRDKELREEIARELETNGWESKTARLLSQWDPYDQNASSPFFDPEWMFDVNGFDVVIGNPPYVQIQKFPKEQKEQWVAQRFKTYSATADIYCLFYERGAEFLKPGGHLCYITSNKWMRAGYGKDLRNYLVNKVTPEKFVDFGGILVFNSATVDSCVLLLQNANAGTGKVKACFVGLDYLALNDLGEYFKTNCISSSLETDKEWVIQTPQRQRIKDIVETQGVPLEDWDLKINYGIKTGFNDAFYLTQEQRDALIAKEPQVEEILVPLLRGRCVERYATNWDKTWMINSHNGSKSQDISPINISMDYPVVFSHFEKWEKQLIKRQDKGSHWTNLRNCAYVSEFNKPKIIYPNMTKYLPFFYDETDHFFINDKAFIMTSDSGSLEYLTAVMNSSLFRCCFKDNFVNLGEDRRELRKIFFDNIPIKKPTKVEEELFANLVAMIQFAKRNSLDIAGMFLESLIDACVMELYFPEEAKLKELQFMQITAGIIDTLPGTEDSDSINKFMEIANNPKHPIRNQLMRLTIDSPDIFAVIKEEGKV